MRARYLTAVSFVLLLGETLVVAQQPPPRTEETRRVRQPGDEPPSSSDPDQFFVLDAGEMSLVASTIGLLATTQALSEEAKALGKSVVALHDKLRPDLQDLAAKLKSKLPTKPTKQDQAEVDALMKLSGPAFDRRYATAMAALTEKAVSWFEKARKETKNEDIKKLVDGALPKLEEQLKAAKALKEKLTEEPKPAKPETKEKKPEPDAPKPDRPEPPDKPEPERP